MCSLGAEDEETKSRHAHSSNFFSDVFYQHWDGSADTALMDRDWLCLWSLNVQLKNKCTQILIQTYCFF